MHSTAPHRTAIPPVRRRHLRTCGNVQRGSNCLPQALALQTFFRDVFVEPENACGALRCFMKSLVTIDETTPWSLHNLYARLARLLLIMLLQRKWSCAEIRVDITLHLRLRLPCSALSVYHPRNTIALNRLRHHHEIFTGARDMVRSSEEFENGCIPTYFIFSFAF